MEGASPVIQSLPLSLPFTETRFLVIGGNGFLGYKLVEALVGRGARPVRILDRCQTHFDNVTDDIIDFHVGDICDPAQVARAVKGMDVVYLTASFFGNPAFGSFGQGQKEWQVNVGGARAVVEAVRREAKQRGQHIRLIYFGSSSSVFNGSVPLKNAPDDTPYPATHIDHYGRCKAIAEQEVMKAHNPSDNLSTLVLRPNGIYGENEIIHIPRVVRMSRRFFSCLPAYFDTTHLSDWTFIDNLIFASFLAAEKLAEKGQVVGGNVYNITDGEPLGYIEFFKPSIEACGIKVLPIFYIPFFILYPIAFLLELVCHLLSPFIALTPPLTRMEAIKMGVTHYFSIEKAKAELGYYPVVTLQEGLKRTADWFREYDPTRPPKGKAETKKKK